MEHIMRITDIGVDSLKGESFDNLLNSDQGRFKTLTMLSLYLIRHALGEEAGLTHNMLKLSTAFLSRICNDMDKEYGMKNNEAVIAMRDSFVDGGDYLDTVAGLFVEQIEALDESVVGAASRVSVN
ncbi:MAG: hypothetical protein KAS32_15550 [Candidatus Peribacteraceae bacterium]|nr:hypothetical protein [Candidatus Peribacteraceae bacterium]